MRGFYAGLPLFLLGSLFLRAEEAPDLVGIWMMGQSLGDGSESLPLVTPTETGWGNLAFQRGVRTWLPGLEAAHPENRAAASFGLVPLSAAANGGLGETVANGLADHLKADLVARRGGLDKGLAPQYLVAFAGQGGRQIQELSRADLSTDPRTPESRRHGGGYYRSSLDDARRAVLEARSRGQTFQIGALYWMQGEGNGGPGGGIVPTRWDVEIPRPAGQEWYRDQLIAYRTEWSRDLAAITGQPGGIPLFTYQTLGPAGEAQIMAADADPAIHLVGPHYAVPSALNSRLPNGRAGDAIHLSADGERWWGEQVGKVMHRVLHLGEEWEPLRPRGAHLDETRASLLVDFIVPSPPLVLEMAFLPRQEIVSGEGYTSLAGFQVRDKAGRPLLLRAVEVVAPTRLRIRLASALPADESWSLNYGHPAAAVLGAITALRPGPEVEGQPTEEMILNQPPGPSLASLADEGAFFITAVSGAQVIRVPVRGFTEEKGATVLRYQPGERRGETPFAVGQVIAAQRAFSYGNLRDSDPAVSIHRFGDPSYGTRVGQSYPLWNWCVLFKNFTSGISPNDKP